MSEYRKPEMLVLGSASNLVLGSKSDPIHLEQDLEKGKVADSGLDD